MSRTPVYIICAARPQVGKTLIARLLTEYLRLQRGSVVAFDINQKDPSLVDFLPQLTETADIETTFGKMQLMDQLIVNDGIAKVLDLGFHVFDDFFAMISQIGFIKEAARRGVVPIVMFVADTDRASARGFNTLRAGVPAPLLIVIDNEHITRGELPDAMAHGGLVHIAALPMFLKTYIDRLNFSFTGYVREERDSSTELHQWVRDNYYSFREIELRLVES